MLIVAIAAALVLGTVQASYFEYAFHKYWLHKPWLPKDCFRAHTLVHHQLCKFDDTFHVTEEEQEEALTFTWYGGPLLIAINTAPWALLALALNAAGVSFPWAAFLITFTLTIAAYYACYEGFHFLMHKPTVPFIERMRVFRFMKRRHVIHHVQMDKNLNVVLPLADWTFGTLVLSEPLTARATPESARRTARLNSRRRDTRERARISRD